jgi:hypothetical protein
MQRICDQRRVLCVRKRNKRIGRRALARELARARVHASERADGPEDGMHIRHRKFCDIETLL